MDNTILGGVHKKILFSFFVTVVIHFWASANIYWSKSQGKKGDAIYGLPLKQHTNFWKNTKNAASKIKTINQQKNTPPWPDVCEVTITQLGEILCKLHS